MFIDKAEQVRSLYNGFQGYLVQKWPSFCAQTSPSLCYRLIYVRGKLNPANRNGLNFRKYPPLLACRSNSIQNLELPLQEQTKMRDCSFQMFLLLFLQNHRLLSTISEWIMALALSIVFASFASEFRVTKVRKPEIKIFQLNSKF